MNTTTDAHNDDAQQTFSDFDVDERIVSALEAEGITHPFPIQALTLPVALKRHDIIGQAKTGTGKTLGFGLPMLCDIADEPHNKGDRPLGCVILPTRELAQQVADDLTLAGRNIDIRVVSVFGGRGFSEQIDGLKAGCDIVVGTPGRMLDLIGRKVLFLDQVRTLVLDEADEMLDLGFLPDIERLVRHIPNERHTMLFSATMPSQIMALARNYMDQPTHIRAQDPDDDSMTVSAIRQIAYRCHELNKDEVLARILQARGRGLTIVFSQTKRAAQNINDELLRRGFASATIHGDLHQSAREQALNGLREGKIDVLVATDVAARGIDIDDVTHVINYQCPEDSKTYVHRIGRTGRAGHTGTAITFVDWEDTMRWRLVVKDLDLDPALRDPLETYHTSDHLYEQLDIPRDATGELPEEKRTRTGIKQRRGRPRRTGRGNSGKKRSRKRGANLSKKGGARNGGRNGGRDAGRAGRSGGRSGGSSRSDAGRAGRSSGSGKNTGNKRRRVNRSRDKS